MRRRDLINIGATLGALWAMSGELALADDLQPQPLERIATASSDSMPSARRDLQKAGGREFIWLLVQSTQPGSFEGERGEDTVLATFPLSAPETLEEEVAKAHGLEIVSRRALSSLGLRLVRYRVPETQAISTVVDRLQADTRVESAQANMRYALPDQNAPKMQPSEPQEKTAVSSHDAENDKRTGSQTATERVPKSKRASRETPERRKSERTVERLSSRVGRIGDVLAGGL